MEKINRKRYIFNNASELSSAVFWQSFKVFAGILIIMSLILLFIAFYLIIIGAYVLDFVKVIKNTIASLYLNLKRILIGIVR